MGLLLLLAVHSVIYTFHLKTSLQWVKLTVHSKITSYIDNKTMQRQLN